ncbi:MAG: hypothetical protein EKK55_07805 [Rhodocyclaceae bacterium]|nr:MAG: hypothetical protein EKK55_07805 [Rhodocyclaceae bacterium]
MSDVLNIARWYVSQGISVIPVKADGSKSPSISGWRKYSNELPTEAELEKWFGGGQLSGIGVPCGPASGNLLVLDFEYAEGESAYFQWFNRLPDDLQKFVKSLPTVSTPSGGRHIWIRLTESQPGAKLARYANGKTKIEIRGEGHQVLAPGCPRECHSSGELYAWVDPDHATEFPEVDADTLAELIAVCCACNDYQAPEQPRDWGGGSGGKSGSDSPGNDFNRRGSWAETGLMEAGWTAAKLVGADRGFLTRPGKSAGISASMGMVSSRETGYPYLYVWSTSVPEFSAETPYSRFAVFAILKHKGDYSAAAKDLQRLGYGERVGMSEYSRDQNEWVSSEFVMKLGTEDGKPAYPFKSVSIVTPVIHEGGGEPRCFKWMSELSAQADDVKWIWNGYLARGGITLLSALWKSGKSTLLSHLLKALGGSESQFLGQAVQPSRVLYVSEEHESIWADRRDNLLIGDHVGMACRPFKNRPTMVEWRDYLKLLAEETRKHQFDLIVFDTLSKMWPVREENDAGQVEEALMPLWDTCKEGVAILLVHHTRKSGGEQFVSSRGSGGLPAFCEILIEFGPTNDDPKETKRLIKGKGRFQETPIKLLAELQNGRYVGLGDPDDAQQMAAAVRHPWEQELMVTLSSQDWMSVIEIREAMTARRGGKGIRNADLVAVLGKRFEDGEIERDGTGNKGDAYRYRLPRIEQEQE